MVALCAPSSGPRVATPSCPDDGSPVSHHPSRCFLHILVCVQLCLAKTMEVHGTELGVERLLCPAEPPGGRQRSVWDTPWGHVLIPNAVSCQRGRPQDPNSELQVIIFRYILKIYVPLLEVRLQPQLSAQTIYSTANELLMICHCNWIQHRMDVSFLLNVISAAWRSLCVCACCVTFETLQNRHCEATLLSPWRIGFDKRQTQTSFTAWWQQETCLIWFRLICFHGNNTNRHVSMTEVFHRREAPVHRVWRLK